MALASRAIAPSRPNEPPVEIVTIAAQSRGAVEEHIEQGETLFSQSNWDGAIKELQAALRLDPSRVDARANLAMAYYFKGDLSAAAPECQTVLANGLQDRVSLYVSDNMKSIPASLKFDLVVGNPPNYCSLNPQHHDYYWLHSDVRANDPGWRIHEQFFCEIPHYLTQGAYILLEEVEPFSDRVYSPKGHSIPWDIRPEAPIKTFQEMISRAGLRLMAVEHFHTDAREKLEMSMLVITNGQ